MISMAHERSQMEKHRELLEKAGPVFQVVAWSCLLVLLVSWGCCNDGSAWLSTSMVGKLGPDGEYGFFVCATHAEDGSVVGSPVLIYPEAIRPYPIDCVFEDGQYRLSCSGQPAIVERGAPVLFYDGPDRPLRELAPTWDTRYVNSREAMAGYLEARYLELLRPDAEEGNANVTAIDRVGREQ